MKRAAENEASSEAVEPQSKRRRLTSGDPEKTVQSQPSDFWRPKITTARAGTLLEPIPVELYPIIQTYWFHHNRRQAVPIIKETYEFKSRFGDNSTKGVFDHPNCMVIDQKNHLWVIDERLHVFGSFFAKPHILQTILGSPKFSYPSGLAVDFDGNIVVVGHQGPNCIQIFDSSNYKELRSFGPKKSADNPDGQLNDPCCVTVNNEGNLVVTDYELHCVQVFSPTGVLLKRFGEKGKEPGMLDCPMGVAVDNNTGNIIVADRGNHRLQVFTSEGELVRVIGSRGNLKGEFYNPWSVVCDRNGAIVVCDESNNRIQIISNEGKFLYKFGSRNSEESGLSAPRTAILDGEGNIIICDTFHHQIKIFG